LFELAYLPPPPELVVAGPHGRAAESSVSRSRCSGRAVPAGGASRQTGKRRAHPIELTAVSAIVLDLLSGFQRPSRLRRTFTCPAAGRPFYGRRGRLSSTRSGREPQSFQGPVPASVPCSGGHRRGPNPPLIRRWFVRGADLHTVEGGPCQP